MRRTFAAIGFVGAIAALGMSASLLGTGTTQAAAGSVGATFIVPSNDGYGIGDCSTGGSGCKVVADAWCEAQGFARSQSFGPADPADMTASIGGPVASRPISITCGE